MLHSQFKENGITSKFINIHLSTMSNQDANHRKIFMIKSSTDWYGMRWSLIIYIYFAFNKNLNVVLFIQHSSQLYKKNIVESFQIWMIIFDPFA